MELARNLAPDQVGKFPQQVKRALRERLDFRTEPELVFYSALARTAQKARRVIKTYEQTAVEITSCPGKKRRRLYEQRKACPAYRRQ